MNSSPSSSSSSMSSNMMSVGFEDSALPYSTDDELSTLTPDDFVKIPLHHVSVRYDDLNENSTRYDRLIAAPSDSEMQIMWLGWSLVTLFCGIVTLTVFTSVLLSPARSKPFNLYLLALMVPDILLSVLCCWTCFENYLLGHYSSFWMCHFQSFYCIFCIASNAWLNAVVCHQLHVMLVSAGKFRRYKPPTTKQVLLHSACCYALAIFVASWTLWELFLPNATSWWPHKTLLVGGVECLPMDFGVASTAFFYCVLFPFILGIPLVYTLYLLYDILANNRLPPKGKRRQLTIYFFRLVLVFVVMWLPGLVFLFITGQWLNPWVKWVGGSWCHFQGAASAIAALWKPDVWKAVKDLFQCRVWRYYRCCRKYYYNSDKQSMFLSGSFGRIRMRRNSSNSSFSWGNISFLGAFGREHTASMSNLSDGLADGSSAGLMSPFGSRNDMLAGDQTNASVLPFDTSRVVTTALNESSRTHPNIRRMGILQTSCGENHEEKDDAVHKDQYADDASVHLEDEYNVAEDDDDSSIHDLDGSIVLLEEQPPMTRRAALVPRMDLDTSSSTGEASVGLCLDNDEEEDPEAASSFLGGALLAVKDEEIGIQTAGVDTGLANKISSSESCSSLRSAPQTEVPLAFPASRRNSV